MSKLVRFAVGCVLSLFIFSFAFSEEIHDAALQGNLERVQKLVEDQNALVHAKKKDGSTPLHMAAVGGHSDILSYLLEKGADIGAKNGQGLTPLFFAVYRNHSEAVRLLVSKGADAAGVPSPLVFAAGQGFVEIVNILLSAGTDVNVSGPFGTALHRATFMGHEAVAQRLLEKGANVNALTRNDWTPLFMAALRGNVPLGKLLVEKGADMQARDTDDRTPLHLALQNSSDAAAEFALFLMENGADLNTASKEGETPLMVAVKQGYTNVVENMLAKGADIHVVEEPSKRTLLHLAAIHGYGDIAKVLLSHGVEVNAVDHRGRTALYYAGQYAHKTVAAELFAHQARLATIKVEELIPHTERSLKEGEAHIWRMQNRGWTVKTQDHLFVFDNEESGRKPDTPSLDNGFIHAPEIADENVLAVYTCYHADPGTLEFIHGIEASLESVAYVHYKGDPWRGNQNTTYLEGAGVEEVSGASLSYAELRTATEMGSLHYLVQADGFTMVYSGFYPAAPEAYQEAVDAFAQRGTPCDVAFLHVPEDAESAKPYIAYAMETLQPRAVFLMDAGRHRRIPEEMIHWIRDAYPNAQVRRAENPGDRFFYEDKTLAGRDYLKFHR